MQEKKQNTENPAKYTKPEGSSVQRTMNIHGDSFNYTAEADWIILRKEEKPRAEMFYVRYTRQNESSSRPLTFVFNGGPGASSVYLHMGAMGPRRVTLTASGEPAAPPYRLTDNQESWLAFTDLVFIDPIGTGLSRMITEEQSKTESGGKTASESAGSAESAAGSGKNKKEYWKLKRDLESICEFIRSILSSLNRWESPLYIAGESYGGFRVGKLVKMLQKDYGVGLSGAILISPAMEFTFLSGSDYDVLHWIDTFPVMAGAAAVHGKARKIKENESLEDYRRRAAEFAIRQLMPVMACGNMFSEKEQVRVLDTAAGFIGLESKVYRRSNGRIEIDFFVKNLLREKGQLLGLYDSSLTVTDPFPGRDSHEGPDPTLDMLDRVFAAGINTQLRGEIGLQTERHYELLSEEANEKWEVDIRRHALETQVGATDDLRYGMSINPDMKVYITHGTFDLVTPYFATDRLARLMQLTEEQQKKLTLKHYPGGHMFYAWEESRKEFFNDIKEFYLN
ncbi:MAG: peptidase S10 [Spirochaetales bacterium]|nr:MAG: peptidase S10 [Spirochaetales bacterium]